MDNKQNNFECLSTIICRWRSTKIGNDPTLCQQTDHNNESGTTHSISHTLPMESHSESPQQRQNENIKQKFNKDNVKFMLALLIPALCIMVLCIVSLTGAVKLYVQSQHALRSVEYCFKLTEFVYALQRERGLSAVYTSRNESHRELLEEYLKVDTTLDNLQYFPGHFSLNISSKIFTNLVDLTFDIEHFRSKVNSHVRTMPLEESIHYYTNITMGTISAMVTYIKMPIGSTVWNHFVAYFPILHASDSMGIQKILGEYFYSWCDLSQQRRDWFHELDIVVQDKLLQSYRYMPEWKISYTTKLDELEPLPSQLDQRKSDIIYNRNRFCVNNTHQDNDMNSLQWSTDFTILIDAFKEEISILYIDMNDIFQGRVKYTCMKVVLYSCTVLVVSILCTLSTIHVYKMTKQLEIFSSQIKHEAVLLEEEKVRTNNLLLKMLPKIVADDLKMGKEVEAESHEAVTVFFSDIVGFTTISSSLLPHQVIDLLNGLYSMFDSTIDQYDVYKVETIGDAYMVVSGLHKEKSDQHCKEITSMAIDLRDDAIKYKMPFGIDKSVNLRIGIHSGPCAAGVVGRTMPRYCLFGDTVNIASRMESTGEALKIHLSEASKTVLDRIGGFEVEERGAVFVKGKGDMKTYWLIGRETDREEYAMVCKWKPKKGRKDKVKPIEDIIHEDKIKTLNNEEVLAVDTMNQTQSSEVLDVDIVKPAESHFKNKAQSFEVIDLDIMNPSLTADAEY